MVCSSRVLWTVISSMLDQPLWQVTEIGCREYGFRAVFCQPVLFAGDFGRDIAQGQVSLDLPAITFRGCAVAGAPRKGHDHLATMRDELLALALHGRAVIQRDGGRGAGAATATAAGRMVDPVEHRLDVELVALPRSDFEMLAQPAALTPFAARIRPQFLAPDVLSDKCELVSVFAARHLSGGAELPPLGESGGSVGLEVLTSGEAAILVEVVGDGGVDGGEELKRLHPPEAQHRPFSSPKRQM